MQGKSIGILLEKREWHHLSDQLLKGVRKSRLLDYVNFGAQSGMVVLFFNIEEINIAEKIGTAIGIDENQDFYIQSMKIPKIVYNTTSLNRKVQNQVITELANKLDIHVLNELTNIKKKHLFEILKTKPKIMPYVEETKHSEQQCFFYIIGQKKNYRHWDISGLFSDENDGGLFSCDEYPNHQLLELLHYISSEIFTVIQYYFPGLDEFGLKFALHHDGSLSIQSIFEIYTILPEIKKWNSEFYQEIAFWPIEKASFIYEKGNQMPEMEMPKQIQQINGAHNLLYANKANGPLDIFWVKMKPYSCKGHEIKLPNSLACKIQMIPHLLKFGVKEEACEFISYEDPVPIWNNSYHNPIEIFACDALLEKMHIPVNMIYQIRFENGMAEIGPTIGFLLGEKVHQYHLTYMEKFLDRFREYDRFGGIVIAFSTRSVDWEEQIAYGMVYDFSEKQWRYGSAPIPNCLYRRNFHQNNQAIRLLQELTDGNLFNSYHFKKSDLYTLKSEPEIKHHLPETHLLRDFRDLIDFLYVKKKIILKPSSLSRGRGIFILEAADGEMILTDYRESEKVHCYFTAAEDLKTFLDGIGIFKQEYLYQTYISLLKVENRPFDVRVVMQKYNKMKWLCSGIECRVAKENEDLTNIARGGDAMTLEEVLDKTERHLSYPTVYKNILGLCQRFCQLMDQFEEHFAEFGIDIALDDEGYPWLLEANIYPSFKGFKVLDYETYLKIRYQPLFYAVQIQGFKILDRDELAPQYSYQEIVSYRN